MVSGSISLLQVREKMSQLRLRINSIDLELAEGGNLIVSLNNMAKLWPAVSRGSASAYKKCPECFRAENNAPVGALMFTSELKSEMSRRKAR